MPRFHAILLLNPSFTLVMLFRMVLCCDALKVFAYQRLLPTAYRPYLACAEPNFFSTTALEYHHKVPPASPEKHASYNSNQMTERYLQQ